MPYLTPEHSAGNLTSPITKRLYISPFNPVFITTILPPTALSVVANTSYHRIETFPERSYGYLDLPNEEAQKLKNKLNGSILRGLKMRVEDARPEKRKRKVEKEVGNGTVDKDEQSQSKRSRRETRKDGVLPAIELVDDRQVKRGWTQPALSGTKSKRGPTDKASTKEGSHLLFRSNLPPNVLSKTVGKGDVRNEISRKRGGDGKAGKAVEIKEFTKTMKHPTFLRDSQISKPGKKSIAFEDGKGWIDDEGNVVEAVRERRSSRKSQPQSFVRKEVVDATTAETVINAAPLTSSERESAESSEVSDESISNSDSSSEDAVNGKATADAANASPTTVKTVQSAKRKTRLPRSDHVNATTVLTAIAARPPSATPPTPPATAIKELHPLEALFKRPTSRSATTTTTGKSPSLAPRPAPIKTSFSFFDADNNADADDNNTRDSEEAGGDSATLYPPQTPFTRRDIEYRGIRSAAPTPDTAAIGRRFSVPWARKMIQAGEDDEENENDDDQVMGAIKPGPDDDGDDDDDEILNNDSNAVRANPEKGGTSTAPIKEEAREETPFEKRFWEQRGENNRNWKARVRERKKEKRQEENRSGVGGGGQRA